MKMETGGRGVSGWRRKRTGEVREGEVEEKEGKRWRSSSREERGGGRRKGERDEEMEKDKITGIRVVKRWMKILSTPHAEGDR